MARKAQKLKELVKVFEDNEIPIEKCDLSILKKLVVRLSKIVDGRHQSYVRHSLVDIIVITLFAVLANANEWQEIEDFGREKAVFLKTFLKLENGIPSDDTFRIVISSLNPKYLYNIIIEFFIEHLDTILKTFSTKEADKKEIISCDGKASCSSKRNETDKTGARALHTLNAYSSNYGICLGQEFVNEKTNEITEMPKLLACLDLQGAIVTWDALNTQKAIVAKVIDGKGNYVGALKGNQHNFYEDVRDYFDDDVISKIQKDKTKYLKTVEKEHSAVVTREYFLSVDIDWLYNKKEWKGLKSIGLERKTIKKNKPDAPIIYEYRFYINSIDNIEDFARSVRDHWGVENGLHWHLDFTFRDDKNTTMKNNGAEGLQIFKKAALAILKIVQPIYPKRTSLKRIRYKLSLSFEKEIGRIFKMLNIDHLKTLTKK